MTTNMNPQDAWRQEGYGVKMPDDGTFNAWAEYADGTRTEFTGSGPATLTYMCEARRNGATRHGYQREQR